MFKKMITRAIAVTLALPILIATDTTEASILLSVIAMNIDRLATMFVRLIWILIFRNPGLQLWGC